ncbi:divalent-cation tolerance protein CutA [Candidatus Hecatella orcuttiae]|jgi:periplasmic divalent cation tolerance protein|uniref:divalent-cation tolerance protein CutA n=1 Tax=Candidatus Hecatella orcuttiae TaxID=1935119 RepID=UPI0028680211|nr:divalent-cation tolerance protein CutA [Candidatus Hecatella orcuttiae]
MEAIVVYTTTSSVKEARKIARHLLRRKLAACVSILGGVESNFWWKGKLDREKECILMVKTLKKHYPSVEREIKKIHSYELPEIIAFKASAGLRDYLTWMAEAVEAGPPEEKG